jgi:arylsulfatase A-like enzyme
LDGLAAQGVRFANHFAASPVCSPSRGAIMTGRYPQSNGLLGLTQRPYRWRFRPGERHLSHILRGHGYHAVLIHHQHETGEVETLGFDEVIHHADPEFGRAVQERFVPASQVADLAAEFLRRQRDAARPFFAQVGFFETHTPYDFGGAVPCAEKGVDVPPSIIADDAARNWLAAFQGSVLSLDRGVGRILDALAAAGLADRTLVIFTVDHGVEIPGGKWLLYDAGIKTALLMRWPDGGIGGGRACEWLTSNVDLAPTLLDLVGLPAQANMDGRSFASFFRDPQARPTRDAVFAMMHGHFRWHECRCVRTDRHKLIRNLDPSRRPDKPVALGTKAAANERPVVELYDLDADPWEMRDLADLPEYRAVRADLSERLWRWLEEVNDPLLTGPVVTPYYRMAMADYRFSR